MNTKEKMQLAMKKGNLFNPHKKKSANSYTHYKLNGTKELKFADLLDHCCRSTLYAKIDVDKNKHIIIDYQNFNHDKCNNKVEAYVVVNHNKQISKDYTNHWFSICYQNGDKTCNSSNCKNVCKEYANFEQALNAALKWAFKKRTLATH